MCMGRYARWRRGLVTGAGLAAASFALAVTFGAFAVRAGATPVEAVSMSALAFSGSAQFAFFTVFAAGGSIGSAVGSASLMNLRFIPMAVSCGEALSGGRLRRGVEAQLVIDGSWAAAQRPDGSVDRDILLPATFVQWPAWVAGTAIGAFASPPERWVQQFGLDAVFPAFFIVLLVDVVRQRPELRGVLLLAAAVTAVTLWLLPEGLALVAGALPALLTLRDRESS